MTNFSYTAHQNNFQLDLLGRPIKVGDRVLTKGYGSAAMNNFATVIAVNRKSVLSTLNSLNGLETRLLADGLNLL